MEKIKLKSTGHTLEEIRQVAQIHRQEIKTGFLSSLGDNVLALLYLHIAKNPKTRLILAIDQTSDCVCGFICGTLSTKDLFREFAKDNFLKSIVYIFPKLIWPPAKIFKALETLLYPAKKAAFESPNAELINFAIKENYRGSGLSKRLFDELVVYFKSKNVTLFGFTTGECQIAAQKFYNKIGAEKVSYIEVHRGTRSIFYVYRLNSLTDSL